MRIFPLCLFLLCVLLSSTGIAQVKPEYLYNPNMPYGILDIRTRISSTNYYYLVEGKTFSFRENADGNPTDTYLKMTNFDTSPYTEGHMRHKKGSDDNFEMNYRFLFPRGHRSTYQPGYPLIVLMHGAVERANCYYEECYHGGWEYDPNTNSPPAPTEADHKLLNNDHHLSIGAREHLAARNRAGDRLPDDPSMPDRSFPGFVLMPQMFNDWDSLWVDKVLRLVQLHVETYNIDPNRIYIHGLSIGGYATYEALKRAPWLFTAALPMSAVSEAANIFKHNQQNRVAHIPLWVFQGARDQEPTVAWTKGVIQKFRDAGSSVRYTEYPDLAHNVWGRAYAEPEFFSWMLTRNKSDIHALFQRTEINKKENQYPELVLAEGYFAYQWEKDGNIIAGATAHKFVPTEAGAYRARFSRVASPSADQWNRWSSSITITRIDQDEEPPEEETPDEEAPEDDAPEDDAPEDDAPEDDAPEDDASEDDASEDDEESEDEPDQEGEPEPDEGEEEVPAEDDTTGGQDDEDGDAEEDGEGGQDSEEDEAGGEQGEEPSEGDSEHSGPPEDGDGVITSLPGESEFTVQIFPNPVWGQSIRLDIHNPSGEAFSYVVTDALGRTMDRGELTGSGEEVILDSLDALHDGVYILVIRQGELQIKRRIIVRNR